MSDYTNRQIEIIQSAGKIITETGVSSLTTKRISQEMKFSESAIYRHFSGKSEIVNAMLDYLATDMDRRFTTCQSSSLPPMEKLKFIFIDQLKFFKEKPYFVGVIFPDGLLRESSEINDGIVRIMEVRKKHLHVILEECQSAGLIRTDLAASQLAHIFMGSFRLLTLKWRLSDFGFDISLKSEQLLSNLFKLIKPCGN